MVITRAPPKSVVAPRTGDPTLTDHAVKLLPYRGLGSGIPRALDSWPVIELIDDVAANQFRVGISSPPVAVTPPVTERLTPQVTERLTPPVTPQVTALLAHPAQPVDWIDMAFTQLTPGWRGTNSEGPRLCRRRTLV